MGRGIWVGAKIFRQKKGRRAQRSVGSQKKGPGMLDKGVAVFVALNGPGVGLQVWAPIVKNDSFLSPKPL